MSASESDLFAHASILPADLADLQRAVHLLESPSLAIQIADLIGQPFEATMRLLPERLHAVINTATNTALLNALHLAVRSLEATPSRRAHIRAHRLLTASSGAIAGALGPWTLILELPFSTTLMLRAIADIARAEGQDLNQYEAQLACLEVFALGGVTEKDNAVDSSYWVTRTALAKTFADAATWVAERGVVSGSAPAVVRYVGAIALRLSPAFAAQLAVRAVPIISAATAAGVNVLFMSHFQSMATGHFIVRRLEAKYGQAAVAAAYLALSPPSRLNR